MGWPARIPFEPTDDEAPPVPSAKPILDGRLDEALAASPWPRWLEDVSSDPAGAPVWSRIGRRGLGGDRAARAAFWSAMRAGRYRWIHYVFEADVHTLGFDPATLPHWIADLDSNCCRISDGLSCEALGTPFYDPLGLDYHRLYDAADSGVGRPPSHEVLDLFRRTGGAWVWSPILDDRGDGLDAHTRVCRIPAPE